MALLEADVLYTVEYRRKRLIFKENGDMVTEFIAEVMHGVPARLVDTWSRMFGGTAGFKVSADGAPEPRRSHAKAPSKGGSVIARRTAKSVTARGQTAGAAGATKKQDGFGLAELITAEVNDLKSGNSST